MAWVLIITSLLIFQNSPVWNLGKHNYADEITVHVDKLEMYTYNENNSSKINALITPFNRFYIKFLGNWDFTSKI